MSLEFKKRSDRYSKSGTEPAGEKRSEKRGRRLVRAVKIAAGAIMLSAAATEAVLFIMFGRSKSISTERFPLAEWARSVRLSWTKIEFPAGDNLLRGYLIAGAEPKALMVIAHGMNATSDGFEPVVQYFARRGYATLVFDGTASGRSEGMRVVGLQQARYDIRAALEYVKTLEKYSDIPIVLLGHSAGAYGAAVEAASEGVSAVVCLSGFKTPLSTMHYWARSKASILGDIEYPFLWAKGYSQLGAEANESACDALCACGVPALIVHGAADTAIPLGISLYDSLINADPSRITCLMESDARHNAHSNILFTEKGEANYGLLDDIAAFLQPITGCS